MTANAFLGVTSRLAAFGRFALSTSSVSLGDGCIAVRFGRLAVSADASESGIDGGGVGLRLRFSEDPRDAGAFTLALLPALVGDDLVHLPAELALPALR
ncbi:MAG TPA: hypothetical protein VF706_03140 [Solirubrobacteraceae bacterium]